MPLGFGRESCTGLSPSMARFSKRFHFPAFLPRRGPTTPVSPRRHGFGLFRVRSPLLTESLFIFSSYGYLDVSVPHVRLPLRDDRPSTCRVAPFGNLRIKDYLHLPPAYRSLSRPSSPPRAKASTVCPCLLSLSMTQFSKLIIKQLIINLACRIDISLACSYFFCYFTFLKLSNTSKILCLMNN